VFASDSDQKLVVNLTSDEMNRATMAIALSTKVLTQKKIPVTIFLSVEAVRIVDMNIPEHRHANGKSLKEMLSEFMEEGGRVILCGMCAKNVGGIKNDEVLEGVQHGGGMAALFEDDTTVMTY
jgi:predicted peroxiredoxin